MSGVLNKQACYHISSFRHETLTFSKEDTPPTPFRVNLKCNFWRIWLIIAVMSALRQEPRWQDVGYMCVCVYAMHSVMECHLEPSVRKPQARSLETHSPVQLCASRILSVDALCLLWLKHRKSSWLYNGNFVIQIFRYTHEPRGLLVTSACVSAFHSTRISRCELSEG